MEEKIVNYFETEEHLIPFNNVSYVFKDDDDGEFSVHLVTDYKECIVFDNEDHINEFLLDYRNWLESEQRWKNLCLKKMMS